jgi:thiol-disulfide isomerase/thioredoxin
MQTLILVLAFTIVVVLIYRFWGPVREAPKRTVPKDEATLYFFYTNWCGWSKKAMPEWQKVETALAESAVYGTTTVKPVRVNAEDDPKTAGLYEVDGYPTILLETHQGIYRYTKLPTESGLIGFLRDTLGEPAARL